MLKLRKNSGTILEPSCGDGAFFNAIENCVGIEYDVSKCPENALCMDFFDYPTENKFDTIIGNPPYVRFQDILPETKKKLNVDFFDKRSNLYLFFIYKCILHLNEGGELIFIVPRDFLKSTSSINLNNFIYENGTITDIIDLGDAKNFDGAQPNCVIFRFEKGNFSRITNENQHFNVFDGHIYITKNKYNVKFSDLFFVKVGAVSGADKYFISDKGNTDFVCSYTKKTGKTKRMFYNIEAKELLPFKDELIKRKIKNFNEENWYMFGRNYFVSDSLRIYVNCKTRNPAPFFYHKEKAYDGSVLAIFPKFKTNVTKLKEIIDELNKVDWEDLGFVCDGRFLFSQKSLEDTILPETFKKFCKK